MRKLTIYKRYFYESDCYNGGHKQPPMGVQVHSTGANNPYLRRYVGPDDGRIGKNKYKNYSNRPGTTVCASAYIGKMADGTVAVYQSLPWNYRCWLSGSGNNGNANKLGYIGFEICEDDLKDKAYFQKAVMETSVNLTAHLCTLMGVTPYTVVKSFAQGDALAVMDHKELHALKLASNHADIRHWLVKYGLTMDDYRAAVQAAMEEGVEVEYIDCDAVEDISLPALYTAIVTPSGSYLNIRASKSVNSTSLWKLHKGDKIDVLDDTDPNWWRVRYADDVVGYAMTNKNGNIWLKKDQPEQAVEKPPEKPPEVPVQPESTWTVTIHGLSKEEAEKLSNAYSDVECVETVG